MSEANKQSSAVFKRFGFSLTDELSERIDALTTLGVRVTRSDVVKAGVEALERLPKDKQQELIRSVKTKEGN